MKAHHPTLGKLIAEPEQRDAIHIAVAPVVASEELKPGQHIGFSDNASTEKVSSKADTVIGIVDPFLTKPVQPGQRFWMLLYPQTVTNLRHDWTHPSFIAAEVAQKFGCNPAMLRLREIANDMDVTYDDLLFNAERFVRTGEYWCEGEKFESFSMPGDFWDVYHEATGLPKPADDGYGNHFLSCSC